MELLDAVEVFARHYRRSFDSPDEQFFVDAARSLVSGTSLLGQGSDVP
ncbi:hypothetical protein [Actinomadura bangladeshensis]|nr:hypothetical protein [Actinomadura bangladeshensis]